MLYEVITTSFEYESMNTEVVDGVINVLVTVKNTGDTAGKEVVEIYTSKPETEIDRPVQELKAFAKTPLLNPGESVDRITSYNVCYTKLLRIVIPERDLARVKEVWA